MTVESVKSIVVTGYMPLDIVQYRRRFWHSAGGTAGNVAAILGFLNWTSYIAGDLGNDLAGLRVRRDLRKSNVSTGLLQLADGVSTPRIIHEISDSGHRFSFRCPSCQQKFTPSRPLRIDRAEEIIEKSNIPDFFFFDRLNAGTIMLAEHYASFGSKVIFEPSRPARLDLTVRVQAIATVIKYSAERETGLDIDNPKPGQVWVVTRGANGASYRVGKGKWHLSPAHSFPIVDAGGAGDWTSAGLIHVLSSIDGMKLNSVREALNWSQALATISCGFPGARGLARRHSADAVVSSASFFDDHHVRLEDNVDIASWKTSTAPKSACKWCLMKTSSTRESSLAV